MSHEQTQLMQTRLMHNLTIRHDTNIEKYDSIV